MAQQRKLLTRGKRRAHWTSPDYNKAHYLANKLGCELEYRRSRNAKHVEITLPPNMKMAGSADVDAIHHECELDEDIWPGVVQELEALQFERMDDEDDA